MYYYDNLKQYSEQIIRIQNRKESPMKKPVKGDKGGKGGKKDKGGKGCGK